MALLALKTNQAPTGELVEVSTTNNSTLKIQLLPDDGGGGGGPFVAATLGSSGAFYPADSTPTPLLNDALLPAELVFPGSVAGDQIQIIAYVPWEISINTRLSVRVIASDDGFATQVQVPDTDQTFAGEPASRTAYVTMLGVFVVPSDGDWAFRIELTVEPDPDGVGVTFAAPDPLWWFAVTSGSSAGSTVQSIFGRSGIVTAQAGDYSTDQIANLSSVPGATDSDALDAVQADAAAAQTTANTAVTNAAAAQTTANTAVTNAAAAQTTANTAVTDAAAAQTTANTAVTNAATAQAAAVASAEYHWGAVSSSASTAARFLLRTFAAVSATEAQGQITAGRACTLTSIRATAAVASPTDSITFTLRVNGANTAITLTVPATQTSAVATGFNVAVAAGDRLSMQMVQSGTDTVSTWNCDVTVY